MRLDCGLQVSGSADVTLNSETMRALLHPNDQTGHRGEFVRDGDHCSFKLARFYSTRAVPRAKYLASDLSRIARTSIRESWRCCCEPCGGRVDWIETLG